MSRVVDRCMLWLVCLYAAAIPLVGNRDIDVSMRVPFYRFRSIGVVIATLLALAAYLTTSPDRLRRLPPGTLACFSLSMAFAAYYAVAGTLRDNLSIPLAVLFAIWAMALYLVFPMWLRNLAQVRALITGLLLANLITWIIGFALDPTFSHHRFTGRISLGFANPNSYAQILQIVFACALFLLSAPTKTPQPRVLRLALYALMASAAALAYLAMSRNVLVFMLVIVAVYSALHLGTRLIGFSAAAAFLGMAGIMGALESSDTATINALSSGRLTYWSLVVEQGFGVRSAWYDFLIGPSHTVSAELATGGYNDMPDDRVFRRDHFDNSYVALLVQGGLIGLALFLMPHLRIVRVAYQSWRHEPARRACYAWYLAVAAGIAAQSFFVATIPTFNNSVGLFIALLTTSALSINADPLSIPISKRSSQHQGRRF